jgi:signal transduction histidine kinase/putative methionine-R-sulfoxide reductase with GAF domain
LKAKREVLIEQLRHACRYTDAEWGTSLFRGGETWEVDIASGLRKDQIPDLTEFLAQQKILSWLDDRSQKGRGGYRTLGDQWESLAGEKVFVIPTPYSFRVLLVGADELSKGDMKFFESLTPQLPASLPTAIMKDSPPLQSYEAVEVSMELPENMARMLETVGAAIPGEYSLLAIRSGDDFTINAVNHLPEALMTAEFSVGESSPIYPLIKNQQVVQAENCVPFQIDMEGETPVLPKRYWMAAPIILGQRVIGMLAFGRKTKFEQEEIKLAGIIGVHIAPSIEKSILSVEAAYYLQRFALLNELATLASSGMQLHEVIRRAQEMLRRAFGANEVKVLLLDGKSDGFMEYSGNPDGGVIRQVALGTTLETSALEIGQSLRIGRIEKPSRYVSSGRETAAKLVVPMRFRGSDVGVISLESSQQGAFTDQDEKFITVVASQMASMVVSIRLNSEIRRRANNMLQINEIVQDILGLGDIHHIAAHTATLMAEKFDYEMVLVMLLEPEMEELIAEGVAGSLVSGVPVGFRFAKGLGIPGEVLKFGESVLLPNVNDSEHYVPIPGWDPGSGIWSPLREGKQVFGVISVEDQQAGKLDADDLVVIEAIAGILSSVLTNARQYDQLQRNVKRLEAVRATALDIGTDLDLDILLRQVVNRVRILLDARGAELGFIDESEEVVRVLVSENPWQDYTGYSFPFMEGVTGRVAATGSPLLVLDFNNWSGRGESVFKAPFSTVAGVPLKLMGEVIGTLTVQDDRPTRSFSEEDLRTLELLAPQLAIFIRNARLYQELEERVEAQRLAEERLVRSAKLAAVGEMAAAVAHELNNPLTTVAGFTELIMESMPKESPEYEDMSLVLSEAQRSREVVRRLLDFSRQSDILRVDTDLNEIITMVLQLVHHLAQTSNIKVRMELWEDIPIIRADRNQMQQVILNLIHNAIYAMEDGGELVVQSLMEEGDNEKWLVIVVSDTGRGIEEENLDKIFEPFFTTKPSGEGTGLGLSVSYSIVSEHGGYIEVDSEVGKGSVFKIWLPAETRNEVESPHD